ncbi:adenosylcobinamide-phosphate synthase CbiB [Oricola thermophila]|uniref:Cobalamin biosynthesis protein CobD n=1 Tax=Oricola thermophila TaxID=2742145 RepID=A0A6N1V8V0_9HYPH|nr:adenosylcobinamide-phosphate synthase CbiB [Oricola thermophila]QKV17411.1 cobalamin biosynthesis protein [Oricola thermophila]
MYTGGHFTILLIAIIVDRLVGDPDIFWRRISHPVAWFGYLIDIFERTFNLESHSPRARRLLGTFAIVILVQFAVVVGHWMRMVLDFLPIVGVIAEIAVVSILIAQKSLADHVCAVAEGLRENGLSGGRSAVSRIVGRDPETLDEFGVSRAAIESLAENASDGVIAPVFWYAAAGLPGLLAYKMLNTADSMIGHRSERYRCFGWATARLDDLANWIPARLTGVLIALAAASLRGPARAKRVITVMWRDARLHRSPNAGWPEAAMAAAVGVALGGPRIYAGDVADEPFMNVSGGHSADAKDIDGAVRMFWRTMTVAAVAVAALAILLSI